MTTANYFEGPLAAERYAAARPNIHPEALSKIVAFGGMKFPVDEALDVGCGTGQSSVAVADIARHVVGIDPSSNMLAACFPDSRVEYKRSGAEGLPADDSSVDLVTAAQAFHWFDRTLFLPEAHRVLRSSGWLVIYNSWFTGQMKEDAAFEDWFFDVFLSRYPSPSRNDAPITDENMRACGFSLRGEEEFSNDIDMSVRQFTDFELSTTNVIAASQNDRESFDEAERWIRSSIEPFFSGNELRIFRFSGRIWHLQRLEV